MFGEEGNSAGSLSTIAISVLELFAEVMQMLCLVAGLFFFPFKRKCLVNILGGFSWVEQGEPGPHCSCWCWSLLESLVVLVLLALGELGVMLPVL